MKTKILFYLLLSSSINCSVMKTKTSCLDQDNMSTKEVKKKIKIEKKSFPPIIWNNFNVTPKAINLTKDRDALVIQFIYNNNDNDVPTISAGPLIDMGEYKLAYSYVDWYGLYARAWNFKKLSFSIQLHMVFYSSTYVSYGRAKVQKNGLAIAAFDFELNPMADDKELAIISNYIPDIRKGYKSIALETVDLFPLERLIGIDWNDYFTYISSYTNPVHCAEDVAWIDFVQPLAIRPETVNKLRTKKYKSLPLFRHTQLKHNPRSIIYRAASKCASTKSESSFVIIIVIIMLNI